MSVDLRNSDSLADANAVAIVGMAGRFPGAKNLDEFWRNLRDGVESLTTFTEEELQQAGIPPATYKHPHHVNAGTILEDPDLFDAAFFGYSPREAEVIDPQQRMFLECSWQAMEDAGYTSETYDGLVGVYAGVSMNTYYANVIARNPKVLSAAGGYQLMIGNDKDFLPTRVSYKLNLKGPSLTIQTACSTSLVAVQVAYQSLLKHQCDMALVGGASLTVPQRRGYMYQEGMIFSPDGHCRPFDARARGTRAGHGVGIVVLKRLADAVADGDTIRAVIRGAAINNDGAAKIGFTAPSIEGQAEVVAMAQALAQVDPETITYVESHGTGTVLGDPIEIAALTQVFRASTDKKQFCGIGSVKSNIGHLDAAAGVTSLIKTVLALEHKQIPPSLNFETPNPEIDFANSPFYVNATLADWPSTNGPRRSGVSSFGIGGTNAHVIVEEALPVERSESPDVEELVVISARTAAALDEATRSLSHYLDAHEDVGLGDVAYTLQVGRAVMEHRRMVVCSDREDAAAVLRAAEPARVLSGAQTARSKPVVFMFSGQGSQYVNMGRRLYEAQPVFREHVDACAERLIPHLNLDIRDVLFPPHGREAPRGESVRGTPERLHQTWLAQPALLTVEYALAKMWMAFGIVPDAMIGHSIGEYVAACLAGVLSLDDALALVAIRGRMMQDLPDGKMLSVSLPERDVVEYLDGHGSLAAVNAPALCTVSGSTDSMSQLEATFNERGVSCRPLHTSHAFHSAMMDPILEPFTERARTVQLAAPGIRFLSNVSGTWISDAEATDPSYWAHHLRRTVRFGDGVLRLLDDGERIFLEVGPGNTLSTFVRQAARVGSRQDVLTSLPHARDDQPADRFAMTTLGRLWLLGANVDWRDYHGCRQRRRIPLPTYPFERQSYWVKPAGPTTAEGMTLGLGKRPDVKSWFYTPSWARSSAVDPPERHFTTAEGGWLVFLDGEGVGAALAQRLRESGKEVSTVSVGQGFEELEPGSYAIDPANRDDYDRLIEVLGERESIPLWIIHLWSISGDEGDPLERLDRTQQCGFQSLLCLLQAVGRHGWTDPMRITVVSNDMQSVLSDDEVTHPESATIIGPCKVIPDEYPNIACHSVDIRSSDFRGDGTTRLVDRLLAEAALQRPAPVVAYRGGYRWVQTYEAVPLDGTAQDPLMRRDRGVYLIAGGLGGIGLVVAKHLTQADAPVLVLTARSTLPQREDWDKWLRTHDDEEKIAGIIKEIRNLEAAGAEVVVFSADVADLTRMRDVVDNVRERFGAIHGIIHAAGIPGDGIIQLKMPAISDSVLDPKVRGTLVLESLTEDLDLDFFVLCSSINSVYSGAGGADYCGANAFLDAFAHSRRQRGKTGIVSINWDPWQEVGMAVNTEVPPELKAAREESLRNGILPNEGVEALVRILAADVPQMVVSTQELHLLLHHMAQARIARQSSVDSNVAAPAVLDAGRLEQSAAHDRPNLSTTYVAPRTDLEARIAHIWGELLGIREVGIHDDFFELGGHSLLATRVLARLQEFAEVALSLEAVFESPTIVQLAEQIETLRWVAKGLEDTKDVTGEREEFEL